jgi:micrococcal nuclease
VKRRTCVAGSVTAFLLAGAVLACTAQQGPTPPAAAPPASAYPSVEPPGKQLYKVDSVYDGDTLRVFTPGGQSVQVRVLGIDAPEMRRPRPAGDTTRTDAPSAGPECGATQARDLARAQLLGKSVELVEDPTQGSQDNFGRLLRYVQLPDGQDLGEVLLRDGWVWVFEEYPVSRTPDYRSVQRFAQDGEVGGWRECGWSR